MSPEERATRWHLGWGWTGLGVAGSALMAVTSPRLVDPGTTVWWYAVRLPPGRAGNMSGFYLGLVALVVAWLGVGLRLARRPGARTGELVALAALWAAPLLVAPPIFSGDMFSYLAQGDLLRIGLDPYHAVPLDLARHGGGHVLSAVSPFWRATTAPYGPLFLVLMSGVVALSGGHLVAGVIGARLVEVVGIALVARYVPRAARSLGADPARAAWLAVASPLVLLQLVAAGHNDALMCGLVAAAIAFALERRPYLAVGACAIAATVKVPGAAAGVLLGVAWARGLESRAARLGFAARAVVLAGLVVGAVSAGTGVGLAWVSTTLLSTPGKVHLAITPVTAFGWTLARALDGIGLHLAAHTAEGAFAVVALALLVGLGCAALWRARLPGVVRDLGLVLVAAALLGPAAWPWYFAWGLVALAATPSAQRSRALAGLVAGSALLVKPDGILGLPLETAPVCAAFFLAAGVAAVVWRRRSAVRLATGSARALVRS